MHIPVILSIICALFIGCSSDTSRHYEQAQKLIAEGNHTKALRYLNRVIKEDKQQPYKYPLARLQLVKIKMDSDSTDESLINLLEEAADSDAIEAIRMLSDFYAQGRITHKSPKMSFNWAQKAALVGNANDFFKLGLYYFNGFGVAQNFTKAKAYFSDAAEDKHAEAESYMCHLLVNSKYQMLDKKTGLRYCYSEQARKFPRASHHWAIDQLKKNKKGIKTLIKNAQSGWTPSALYLLQNSISGNFKEFHQEIFQLFEKFLNITDEDYDAELIEINALYYRYWQQYPKKVERYSALKALEKAYANKNAMALADWGVFNLDDSPQKALDSLQVAVNLSEPIALATLGKVLKDGSHGLKRDEELAFKYLKSGCHNSIKTACFELGVLLSESLQINRNFTSATNYLLTAAKLGHKEATQKLKVLLMRKPELYSAKLKSELSNLKEFSDDFIVSKEDSKIAPPDDSNLPWKKYLLQASQLQDYDQKIKFLDLSRQSVIREYELGFTRNYHLHLVEQEQFRVIMMQDIFNLNEQMQKCWKLLDLNEATTELKQYFLVKKYKVNFAENLDRLQRLRQTIELHYALQSNRIYSETVEFLIDHFSELDDYYEALMTFRRANETESGPKFAELARTLRMHRGELAIRIAMISKELGDDRKAINWMQIANKDNHPLGKLYEAYILLNAESKLRNDDRAWTLLIDSLKTTPNIDRNEADPPLQLGKAESFLLMSKMIATYRAPEKFSNPNYQYIFLRAASHFQSEYKKHLDELKLKIDPREILKAERQSMKWIESSKDT